MYIIGILIGLYLNISIVFLCIILVIIGIIVHLFFKEKKWIFMLLLILFGSIYVDILDKSYDRKYDAVLNDVEIKAVVITEPEEKEYKYKIICENCGQEIYRNRLNRNLFKRYRCGKCGGKLKLSN